jgi:hypothetical protein
MRNLNRMLLLCLLLYSAASHADSECRSFYRLNYAFKTQEIQAAKRVFDFFVDAPILYSYVAEMVWNPKNDQQRMDIFKLEKHRQQSENKNELEVNSQEDSPIYYESVGLDIKPKDFYWHYTDINKALTRLKFIDENGSFRPAIRDALENSYRFITYRKHERVRMRLGYQNYFEGQMRRYFNTQFPGAKLPEVGDKFDFSKMDHLTKAEIITQLMWLNASVAIKLEDGTTKALISGLQGSFEFHHLLLSGSKAAIESIDVDAILELKVDSIDY